MKKITIDDVLKKSKNLSKSDRDLVKKAFEFAKEKHKKQKRKSGEPYIQHPLYAAYYVADLGLGKDAICAALLHDVIEDHQVSKKKISKEFNKTIAMLVEGVTKLRHTGKRKITSSSVENLRKFFLVAAKDIRVVIIKLADRMHNAQTIKGLPKKRQKSYAKEIKYIYSALAEYLGIYFFKRKFDDVAFKILNPTEYQKIKQYLDKHHKQRSKYIKKVKNKITNILKKHKVKADVSGREKSIYSIHKKVKRYLKEGKIHSESEYGRVYDYFGFRILVQSKEDCYRVLGIIHSLWHPLSNEFDDYIANPKPNGYKSLQTTVFCEDKKLAEIQIRTNKMHEYNEYGPASHIAYKLAGSKKNLPAKAFEWISKISIFSKSKSKKERKNYQINIFKNNIFVLTPDNEVKKLVKGSTPVDFAYSVHTEVGNKCRGAKVNKKMVPLDYELHTGDQVEILIDKNEEYPQPKWLEFVASPGTRNKIKNALRKKEEREAKEKGGDKLNKALKKYNTSLQKVIRTRSNDLSIVINRHNANDLDGLLALIGFDLVSTESVTASLFPSVQKRRKNKVTESKIAIEGSTQTEYSLAKCCNPIPGSEIFALSTINRGIRVHRKDCGYREGFDKDRILRAQWV